MNRQEGQNTAAEQARKDLRAELLVKERKHFGKKGSEQFEGGGAVVVFLQPLCSGPACQRV